MGNCGGEEEEKRSRRRGGRGRRRKTRWETHAKDLRLQDGLIDQWFKLAYPGYDGFLASNTKIFCKVDTKDHLVMVLIDKKYY